MKYVGRIYAKAASWLRNTRPVNAVGRFSRYGREQYGRAGTLQRLQDSRLQDLVGRDREIGELKHKVKVRDENYINLQKVADENLEMAEIAKEKASKYRAARDAMRVDPRLTFLGSLKQVISKKRDPSFVLDRSGAIVSSRGKFLGERLNYDSESLVGRIFAEILHPDDAKEFSHAISGMAKKGTGFSFSVGIKYNGEDRLCPYRLHVTVTRSDDGSEIDSMKVVTKRIRSVGTARNRMEFSVVDVLKEIKHFEEEAKRNEAFIVNFESLRGENVGLVSGLSGLLVGLKGVKDGICVIGVRDDKIYSALRGLGLSHQDQMGMEGVKYFHEEDTGLSEVVLGTA